MADEEPDQGVKYNYCPGCQARILPGQYVTGVEESKPSEENPWGIQALWHTRCLEWDKAGRP